MKAADLRKSILQYAVEGKLVQQNIHDEPADILYDKIIKEKENLIKQGKIKKEKPLPTITDDEMPYDIPNNWKWVRLGEIVSILGDGIHGTPNYDELHGEYYFINGNNLNGKIVINNKTKKVNIDEYNKYKKPLTKRTILVSINGTIGNIAFYNMEKIILGKSACFFNLLNDIDINYMKYIIKSNHFYTYTKQYSTGSTIQNVSLKSIKNFPIPLPPLAEQERIVKKIDELMALCDKLEQEEEKLLSLDKHFADTLPKSILQYAVEGKLVQQNIHDEPASMLYDKIIKEKENLIKQGKIKKEKPLPPITDDEIPYDIPNNWKWVRLGEVCEIYTGNSINTEVKNKKYTNLKQGYNYIATKDVNFNSIIDYNNGIKIPFDEINFKIAKKNTTLICIEGGSAGRKIGFLNQDVCFGNKLCSINGYLLYNKYLFYFAQSPIFLSIFNEYKAGIIGGVSVNLIKNIILPLPPLKEQERIVKKVDELLTYCNKLKDII